MAPTEWREDLSSPIGEESNAGQGRVGSKGLDISYYIFNLLLSTAQLSSAHHSTANTAWRCRYGIELNRIELEFGTGGYHCSIV